jgi:hypothetical protein
MKNQIKEELKDSIKYLIDDVESGLDSCKWKIANHSSNDWSICDPALIESARAALKEIKQLIESIESYNEYE